MARSDRLYALVDELRTRAPRPLTRAQLARRLEVSARTIERDIAALQRAGVPIWTERGRTGGYALSPDWHLPPLNFDAAEALAVVAALASAESLPFADARRRAAQKILAAMRTDEASRARTLASRVRVERPAPIAEASMLRAVEDAVIGRRVVRLQYLDGNGDVTSRVVEAHGLHVGAEATYLLGWCRLRSDSRAFRLDRIGSLQPTAEVAPERDIDSLLDTFDLAPSFGSGDDLMTTGAKPRGRPGPPARADDQSGAGPAFVRAVALALPGTVEGAGDAAAFAVGGSTFLVLGDDVAEVVLDEPEPFRVWLDQQPRDAVRGLIETAWARVAPKRSRTALAKARAARAKPLTLDDVRDLAMSLPRVTERLKSGRNGEVVSWEAGRTMFAKFAEASNLRRPDVDDTLMIRSCADRPALLAADPSRFFVTRHYGDPAEGGAILTRLSENTVDDLDELRELLTESWRTVAPKRVVAAHDNPR